MNLYPLKKGVYFIIFKFSIEMKILHNTFVKVSLIL